MKLPVYGEKHGVNLSICCEIALSVFSILSSKFVEIVALCRVIHILNNFGGGLSSGNIFKKYCQENAFALQCLYPCMAQYPQILQ